MIVKLTKEGDSMNLRIPEATLSHCENHDECELEINENSMVLRPVVHTEKTIMHEESRLNSSDIQELFESVNFSM